MADSNISKEITNSLKGIFTSINTDRLTEILVAIVLSLIGFLIARFVSNTFVRTIGARFNAHQRLVWRNNENIKRWMYSQDDIKLEDHLSYIDSLEVLIDKQYLTVKKNDRYIGVIDFTNIDFENKITDFGLYSNPFEKVAGVGRILEEICIKYAFELLKLDTLKLEVFDENIQVKNLHKKYNFQETGYKIVNGKNVICMELKRKGKI